MLLPPSHMSNFSGMGLGPPSIDKYAEKYNILHMGKIKGKIGSGVEEVEESVVEVTSGVVVRWLGILGRGREGLENTWGEADRRVCMMRWDEMVGLGANLVYRVMKWQMERLMIKNKDGGVEWFILNMHQKLLLYKIAERVNMGRAVLVRILKARQVGFSTFVEAINYVTTRNETGRCANVLAHVKGSSNFLFAIFRRYYNTDPHKKEARITKNELEYQSGDNFVLVQTGYSDDAGRGGTVHNIHFSESAFYRDPDSLIPAMLGSVPTNSANVFVVEESTANGMGGWFHDNWKESDENWINIFVPDRKSVV